jgi:hypothetical protein
MAGYGPDADGRTIWNAEFCPFDDPASKILMLTRQTVAGINRRPGRFISARDHQISSG